MDTLCRELDICNIEPCAKWLTFIRNPVSRFISEWQHVIRAGGGWENEDTTCGNFNPVLGYITKCRWDNIGMTKLHRRIKEGATKTLTFEEFLNCPANLGFNRQTRMLADFSLLSCNNLTSQNYEAMQSRMLESAKVNLAKLDFFGLTEYQRETQILFEKTFNIKFDVDFMNMHTMASSKYGEITEEQLVKTRELNQLDLQLYDFAQKLFLERFVSVLS